MKFIHKLQGDIIAITIKPKMSKSKKKK